MFCRNYAGKLIDLALGARFILAVRALNIGKESDCL